ncbi:hypothetical protein MRX96_030503 [Rhipicephalus microplus]
MSDSRCDFIVARKSRRCRLRPLSGSRYCESSHDRITCPLDSTHTCSSALLEKHLKKCNAKKKKLKNFSSRTSTQELLRSPVAHAYRARSS